MPYVARKHVKCQVGEGESRKLVVIKPGDIVPGAETWPNPDLWVTQGHIVWQPEAPAGAGAPVAEAPATEPESENEPETVTDTPTVDDSVPMDSEPEEAPPSDPEPPKSSKPPKKKRGRK